MPSLSTKARQNRRWRILPANRQGRGRDVGSHVVVADDAEDLHFTGAGRRHPQIASLRALDCGHTREGADVIRVSEPALVFANLGHLVLARSADL